MSVLLSILAAVLYCAACVRLFASLQRVDASGMPTGKARQLTFGLVAIALLLHAWVVLQQTGWPAQLSLPFFTSLALAALGIVLLQLVLCLQQPADYLGLAIYPIAAMTLLLSNQSAQTDIGQANITIHANAIQSHILLSLLAYSVLALAAVQAILVSVQRHFLTRHKPGGFMRALPAFDSTERLLFVLLSVGFVLLTLSLASGLFYLDDMFAQHLVHKTVLSCAAWAIFGILLFGRWRFGWRGKRAVNWTLGGFMVLILAYFGSKFVLELLLQRV